MENKLKVILKGGLPNITLIIDQLRKRLIRLEEQKSEYDQPDAEIIFNEEIQKTKSLLQEVEENQLFQSSDNDIIVENTHAYLELQYLRCKRIVEQRINNLQKLEESDIVNYNNSIWSYNLLFNVIESLY